MSSILQPAAFQCLDIWYALPLIVVVSLVYASTRYEQTTSIIIQSMRSGVWIVSFMAVVFGVLMFTAWWL